HLQDILECKDSMETLNQLNEKGRTKLAELREELENLEMYSKDVNDPMYVTELESQRQQLASLLREFKEANITSMFTVEKAQRRELMRREEVSETEELQSNCCPLADS
ncbi:Vesicle transport protein SEC20, partial [Operophtera brumata]